MARVRWSNQALADLEAIGDFIARDAPSVAQVFVERVFAAVKRLEAFPRSGRVVPEIGQEDIREIIFGSYRIVYVVSEDEVNILTVFHAARLLRPSDLPGGASEQQRHGRTRVCSRPLTAYAPTSLPLLAAAET